VQITRTVGATTYTLFAGHTDDSPLNPDLAAKTVSLNLVDTLADFRGVTIATELYQGIRTGAAIGLVLDAVGWTGGRDLDTGATLMPWWWEDGGDAFTALQKILASEGPPALLTVDTSGGIVFRDRLHRYVRAASTTSQSTWRGDGQVEPVMGGYAYNDAWSNIVNSVTVSVDERSSASIETIWSTDEIITLGPSSVPPARISPSSLGPCRRSPCFPGHRGSRRPSRSLPAAAAASYRMSGCSGRW
jgi:hypothetical protein